MCKVYIRREVHGLMNFKYIIIILASYFIGCFCGAYYYGAIFKKKDLRNFGSRNLGALNSGRVLGYGSFFIVLFIDFFKGVIVILMGKYFGLNYIYLLAVMFSVVLGHMFPIQLCFKGGKGIAVFMGALSAYNYLYALFIIAAFIPIFFIIKRFTISGLISIIILPFIIFINNFARNLNYSKGLKESIAMLVFAALIIYKHKDNILIKQ